MDFGQALQLLRNGKRVGRLKDVSGPWKTAEGPAKAITRWVALGGSPTKLKAEGFWNPHSRKHAEDNGGSAIVAPYFIECTPEGAIQMGWTPTQEDMLAADWLDVDMPVSDL